MNQTISTIVNGEIGDQVSINDRGLLYGDGCFETIAVQQGKLLLWDRHIERLTTGCNRLGIDVSQVIDLLVDEAQDIVRGSDRAVLKIIITRGIGERGYRVSKKVKPTRILSISSWPDFEKNYRDEGIAVRLCDTRLSDNKALAGIKHLNRLEQVLARSEWNDEFQEGFMMNGAGDVVEGTMSNIFVQIGSEVVTPKIESCGVSGVMRHVILDELTSTDIVCKQRSINPELLYGADAIFICNSIIGLWPVTSFEDKNFPITDLERKLQKAIHNVCITE